MDSCTLHIPDHFEETNCFLVKFSNGQLTPSSTHLPKISLYHKIKAKKKKIIVAKTDNLTYVGTNFSPDNAAASSQHCVGALDRSTGTMTLYRAELLTLNPHIPGVSDAEIEVGEEIDVPKEDTDVRGSMDQSVSFFGSARRKRALSAAQRNRLETGALETALEPAFSHAETNIDNTPVSETAFQASGLKPPHNQSAEAPRDVYDVNDIISLAEFQVLKNTAQVFTQATAAEVEEWRANETYPEYVLQHVVDLPMSEPDRSLKAAISLYAGFLIQMHNMNSRKVQKDGLQFVGIPPPPEVLSQLQEKFAESREGARRTQYLLPVRMKDKIRLHLLVLCLILDDFSVECSVLQRDLKITINKLLDYFRALGCVVEKSGVKRRRRDLSDPDADDKPASSSQARCVLKIPLSFPQPRKGRRKKD